MEEPSDTKPPADSGSSATGDAPAGVHPSGAAIPSENAGSTATATPASTADPQAAAPLGETALLLAPRLTIRLILGDLAGRFFSLDRGWLRTAKELCIRPGAMIRRYVAGERRGYANPFAYLLVGTAISILVQKRTGFQETMVEGLYSKPELSPGQVALFRDLLELIQQHSLYMALGIVIPLALLLRLFFRRSGFNVAEMAVFSLFTVGHLAAGALVLVPLYRLISTNPAVPGMIVAVAYTIYAAVGFFGGRTLTALKSGLAYVLAFAVWMAVMFTGIIVYILVFLSPTYTSLGEWNMFTASRDGAAVIVRSLIEKGEDVNLTLRRTPLHVAAEEGHADVVELLAAGGADLNARDHAGFVPLHFAIRRGHTRIAHQLLDAGADPAARADDGTTLLMDAVREGDAELARRLLDLGADVNAVRDEGHYATALMRAAAEDDEELVALLVEHGADPSITNADGRTAGDLAGSDDVIRLLEAAGATQQEEARGREQHPDD